MNEMLVRDINFDLPKLSVAEIQKIRILNDLTGGFSVTPSVKAIEFKNVTAVLCKYNNIIEDMMWELECKLIDSIQSESGKTLDELNDKEIERSKNKNPELVKIQIQVESLKESFMVFFDKHMSLMDYSGVLQ